VAKHVSMNKNQTENSERLHPFRIKLLGIPVLEWEGQNISLSRKQASALIYVLGTTLQPVPRDKVTFLFWPDITEAAANAGSPKSASESILECGTTIWGRPQGSMDAFNSGCIFRSIYQPSNLLLQHWGSFSLCSTGIITCAPE
jgi:hypothetical protein